MKALVPCALLLVVSIVVAQGIGTSGREPAVKTLAASIGKSRAVQLAALVQAAVRTQK